MFEIHFYLISPRKFRTLWEEAEEKGEIVKCVFGQTFGGLKNYCGRALCCVEMFVVDFVREVISSVSMHNGARLLP